MSQDPYSQAQPPQPFQQPPYPQTPPGHYSPPPRRSAWPTVIGWISLGMAVVFLLMGVWGVIKSDVDTSKLTPEAKETLDRWNRTWRAPLAVAGWAANGLLLAAGICALKRRALTRPLHLIYAVLAVLLGIPGAYLAVVIAGGIAMPPNMPPAAQSIAKGTALVALVIGFAAAWAYPAFLIVWFLRGKIARQVRTWAAERANVGPQAGMDPRGDR